MIAFKKLLLVMCSLLVLTATAKSADIQSRFAKFGDIKVHYLDRVKVIKPWSSFMAGRVPQNSGNRN